MINTNRIMNCLLMLRSVISYHIITIVIIIYPIIYLRDMGFVWTIFEEMCKWRRDAKIVSDIWIQWTTCNVDRSGYTVWRRDINYLIKVIDGIKIYLELYCNINLNSHLYISIYILCFDVIGSHWWKYVYTSTSVFCF